MHHWTYTEIKLVQFLGIPIMIIIGYLIFLLGNNDPLTPLVALLVGFIGFVIYAILVIKYIEKRSK